MTYYFTSKTPDLKTAEGAKLTENKMISAFCLANPLEEPWNWFPCDFGSDGTVQYHELFENAFKEATEGKKGWLYSVEAEEEDVEETGEILTVALATDSCGVWMSEGYYYSYGSDSQPRTGKGWREACRFRFARCYVHHGIGRKLFHRSGPKRLFEWGGTLCVLSLCTDRG